MAGQVISLRHRRNLDSSRSASALVRNWMLLFTVLYGIFVGLPFLAPVFMRLIWNGAARAIYFVYSFFCHQLPERSFFLFGNKLMYTLAEIQSAWQPGNNPMVLRQFIGNLEMGWKVAWSDRMIWVYTSVWIFGIIWWFLRYRMKRLPWWGLILFSLPLLIDGTSHFLSDLSGIGQGFRDNNAWLSALTGNMLVSTFYAGDALGSFNSLMRLVTGVLFGMGLCGSDFVPGCSPG
jgi:uncharacterized membrane protein